MIWMPNYSVNPDGSEKLSSRALSWLSYSARCVCLLISESTVNCFCNCRFSRDFWSGIFLILTQREGVCMSSVHCSVCLYKPYGQYRSWLFSLLFSHYSRKNLNCSPSLWLAHCGSGLCSCAHTTLSFCYTHTHTHGHGANPCSFASPLCWPPLDHDHTGNYSPTTNSCQQGCRFNSLSSCLSCMSLSKQGREMSKDTL